MGLRFLYVKYRKFLGNADEANFSRTTISLGPTTFLPDDRSNCSIARQLSDTEVSIEWFKNLSCIKKTIGVQFCYHKSRPSRSHSFYCELSLTIVPWDSISPLSTLQVQDTK